MTQSAGYARAHVFKHIKEASEGFLDIIENPELLSRLYGKSISDADSMVTSLSRYRTEAMKGDKDSRDYLINQYAIILNEQKLTKLNEIYEEIIEHFDPEVFSNNVPIINFEALLFTVDIKKVMDELDWQGVVTEKELINALNRYQEEIKSKFSEEASMFLFVATLIYAYESGNMFLEQLRYHDINNIIVNDINNIFVKTGNRLCKLKLLSFNSEEEYRTSVFENDKMISKEFERTMPYSIPTTLTGSRIATASYDMTPGPGRENTARVERIFNIGDPTLLELYETYNTLNKTTIDLLDFLVKARASISTLGDQGTGKSTFLSALMGLIPDKYSVVVNDFKNELKPKERYPDKDIFMFLKNDYVTYNQIFAFELVASRDIYVQAEIVKDEEITNLIDARLRLNAGTFDTMHTGSPLYAVRNMRNMAMRTGYYKNEKTAESDIAQGLDFVIYMVRSTKDPNRIILKSIHEVVFVGEPDIPEPIVSPDASFEEIQRRTMELEQLRAYYAMKPSEYYYKEIISYDESKDDWFIVNQLSNQLYEKAKISIQSDIVEAKRKELESLISSKE